MAEGRTEASRDTSRGTRRRIVVFVLASGAWLSSFVALERLGTWTPFAVVGSILAVGALLSGAVPVSLLRPSWATIGVGLLTGLSMVAVTHAGLAVVAPLVPDVGVAATRLLRILNVGGFSPSARAALIVLIATCEEVLFRGALPAAPAPPGFRGLARSDLGQVVTLAAGYALSMGTLGSLLLVLWAFACGVAWGVLRVATGSLVTPIVAHVVWDLGVLVVWPLAGRS